MSGADITESVEAYAALEARLAAKSADRPAVFANVGLDVYAMARLRSHWDARFAGDPALESAYHEHMATSAEAMATASPAETAQPAAIPSYLKAPAPAPPPPAPFGPPAAPADADETLPITGIPLGDLLPFRAQPSPEFEAALTAPRALPPSPTDEAGGTQAVDVADLLATERALPFKAPEAAEPPLPDWTPAQFASLQVELSLGATSRAQVLARYGLADEATARRLNTAWQGRMRADPGLRAHIQSLSEQYRAMLAHAQGA